MAHATATTNRSLPDERGMKKLRNLVNLGRANGRWDSQSPSLDLYSFGANEERYFRLGHFTRLDTPQTASSRRMGDYNEYQILDDVSLSSGPKCRICLSTNDTAPIMNPCKCKGTIGLVHSHCLEKWISISCTTRCELCSTKYQGRKKLKYGIMASIPRYLWTRKTYCGVLYCYAKIWIYLYILLSLLKDYKLDMENFTSSLVFLIFLLLSVLAGLFLLVYSASSCVRSWNRWRRCQIRFIFVDTLENVIVVEPSTVPVLASNEQNSS